MEPGPNFKAQKKVRVLIGASCAVSSKHSFISWHSFPSPINPSSQEQANFCVSSFRRHRAFFPHFLYSVNSLMMIFTISMTRIMWTKTVDETKLYPLTLGVIEIRPFRHKLFYQYLRPWTSYRLKYDGQP